MSHSPDPDPISSEHDLHRSALDELPGHALGLPLEPDLDGHVRGCAECQDELAAYRSLAGLARADQPTDVPAGPPPHVWARIRDELALAGSDDPRTATPPPAALGNESVIRPMQAYQSRHSARRRLGRRATAALLTAAAVVGAGVLGWAVGNHTSPADSTAQAALSAQPGTTATAHGRATMHSSGDGYQMQLSTSGLPAPAGYYEVWLFDPSANRMVAIGTLGTGARGTFTVPAGIDTHAYHVVDVSDQRYNGNPAHQTSVLRGSLSTS